MTRVIPVSGLSNAIQLGRDVEPSRMVPARDFPGLLIDTRPPGWDWKPVRIVDRAREIAERRRDPIETLSLCERALLQKMAAGFRVDADRFGNETYASETSGAVDRKGLMVGRPAPGAATRLRLLGYIDTRSNGQAWTHTLNQAGHAAASRLHALMETHDA